MLRLGKRGVYRDIRGYIIAFIVAVIFLTAAKGFGSQIIFNKVYTSKDIALLVNGMHLVPGNIRTAYDTKSDSLSFVFKNNYITAYSLGRPSLDPSSQSHWYADIKDHPLDTIVEKPRIIYLSKAGNKLEVTSFQLDTGMHAVCPKLQHSPINSVSFAIDPGNKPEQGTDTLWQVAKYLHDAVDLEFKTRKITRQANSEKTEEERITEISPDTQLVLGLTTGSYGKYANNVIVYIPTHNSERNNRLACLITNSLLDEFPGRITNAYIYPTEDNPLLKANKDNNGLAAIINIGNTNPEADDNILEEYTKASQAIRKALLEYYEN